MNKVLDNIIYRIAAVMMAVATVSACESYFDFYSEFRHTVPSVGVGEDEPGREMVEDARNVLLLYSAGFNSLSHYLDDDIKDLIAGDVPTAARLRDVLLVYSHLPAKRGSYSQPNSPVLMRIYKDMWGDVVKDTLLVYPESTHSSDPSQLNKVLTYVKDNYPAKTYGMIFSSHASGYLPTGFYADPKSYIYAPAMSIRSGDAGVGRGVPYVEPEYDPSLPMVKSVGQDQVGAYGSYLSYEIQIEEFARAIPMYLDYILFDACLMGGVEVAYELRGKCGLVGFSQTEVLADGFAYQALPTHLLSGSAPDPKSVCMDYFEQYEVQSGLYRSATISLVDCNRLEPVAEICAELFDKYANEIAALDPFEVQRYYRYDCHWFYDLVDIVVKAGASEEDIDALNDAVDGCMVYRAATPGFMDSFTIDTYSGFSMYLPCDGKAELDKYYRTLQWNIATGLVE
ncbi:MAG: hypothetical protein IKV05_06000 [Bacteroidales bacterium]|nr:hypothetical protein [Bacteroidales bacterium]